MMLHAMQCRRGTLRQHFEWDVEMRFCFWLLRRCKLTRITDHGCMNEFFNFTCPWLFWISVSWKEEQFSLPVKSLVWEQHGLEVRNEQLGFRPDRSAQPWWALNLFGRWSPRTWLWPNGIQLYGLLPWCSGSTSLWPLPAINFTRDGAPRWRSSLGPIWPVTAGNTAPKDECELPQGGGRREEGRRVSANRRKYNGTRPIVDPSRHCQNCSDCFGAWNWPNMTWLVPVAVRECDSC